MHRPLRERKTAAGRTRSAHGRLRGVTVALLLAGAGCANHSSPVPSASDRTFADRAETLGLRTPAWSKADWADPTDPYSQPCGRALYSSGGVVAADLSGDGRVDVFVPRLDGPDALFVQQADGRFVDEADRRGVAAPSSSGGAFAVDLTGDGRLDLYVTSPGRADHLLYVARADGTFSEEAAVRGLAIPRATVDACGAGFGATAGDVDGDGDLDVAVAAWLDSPRSGLWLNDGTGHFVDARDDWGLAETSTLAGFSPVLGDLDDDGRVDLLYVGDFHDTRMYWNEGSRFVDGTALGFGDVQDGMGVDLADVDGDGDLDIFVSAICERVGFDCEGPFGFNGNHLLIQTTARTFSDEAGARGVLDGGWGWGAAFWDADEDGVPDLGMTNGYAFLDEYLTDAGVLWRNDGTGVFAEVPTALGAEEDGQGRGYVPVDLDADGDLDLLVTDHDRGLRVFVRGGRPTQPWLTVTLDQAGPNHSAVGATVWARAAGTSEPWRRQDLLAFARYQGHGPLVAHFFIPHATAADVRVRWPDGAETLHAGQPLNRQVTLVR